MMRDHPRHIRSVILDSVYPPQADIYLDAYFNGERALGVLFAACAASAHCSDRYPDLAPVFYQLYEALNRTPLVADYQPPRYKRLEIEISGYRLYDWVFSWLYEVDAIALMPSLIYAIHQGQIAEATRIGVAFESAKTSLSLGMHYTIQCQEEFGAANTRSYASVLAAHPHLSGYLRYPVEGADTLVRLCGLWQAEARPPSAKDAVTSDIPALLLSGNYDPITPPSYADEAAATLSRAFKFVLPHAGHGVLRSDACAVRIAVAFIAEPLQKPDSGCIADTKAIVFR